GQDGRQGVADALGVTRVGDLGKDLKQAKGSGHGNGLLPGSDCPRLPSVPSSANIKVRTALGLYRGAGLQLASSPGPIGTLQTCDRTRVLPTSPPGRPASRSPRSGGSPAASAGPSRTAPSAPGRRSSRSGTGRTASGRRGPAGRRWP